MIVLFVDDEMMILNGIKRALFKSGWKILLANSGADALKLFEEQSIDFIVSDMRMPQMTGLELLEIVAQKSPRTVRIILSGYADEEVSRKACFVAHQWLNKPCQHDILKETLTTLNKTREQLPSENIQQKVGLIKMLPTPPKIFMRLNALLGDDTVGMKEIAHIIAEDPALVAKMLHLTNSSFFSNSKAVESITEAITRLGIDLVCSIVIATETFSQLESVPCYLVEEEQKHCLSSAILAASMVDRDDKKETTIVALLHNIGKFILYFIEPEVVNNYLSKRGTLEENIELEQSLFGVEHTQLSAYLLHLWNFSYPIIDSILMHRQPKQLIQHKFSSSAATYVANQILREQPLDADFIEHFHLEEKIEEWQEKALKYK
ncbi:MAG: HDOD domain-containing protein [Colwellia sp.]